jgi:hypothetical protein
LFLRPPANKAFVPLAGLEDDQSISKWEAHVLERGGMRNTWLRGRENVHKRYLVHVESVGFSGPNSKPERNGAARLHANTRVISSLNQQGPELDLFKR